MNAEATEALDAALELIAAVHAQEDETPRQAYARLSLVDPSFRVLLDWRLGRLD